MNQFRHCPVIIKIIMMKVEIWSDVMCPFCYIGKRRFENGLSQFPDRDGIQVEWKSFQLNPSLKTDPSKNINQYLSDIKGISVDEARSMNDGVTAMAAAEGLAYDFDKAIVANSFDAHRLIQFAKTNGLGDAMEERLFRAYFTEGLDTSDHEVLAAIAAEIGLDRTRVHEILAGDEFAEQVERDIYEAQQIGVRGVPYFVFDDKYAVSGAQAAETFLGALTQSWNEHKPRVITAVGSEDATGATCGPDGNC